MTTELPTDRTRLFAEIRDSSLLARWGLHLDPDQLDTLLASVLELAYPIVEAQVRAKLAREQRR